MAINVTQELKEDTNCIICMERFKDPRMLPCVHTFCMGCLVSCERNLHGREFTCPTCRKIVDIPDGVRGLPKNFYLVNLMEKLDLAEGVAVSPECQFCRVKSGVLFCIDCKCHLCRLCKNVHDRLPGLHDHTVAETSELTDSQYMSKLERSRPPCCDKHPQEKLRFYCNNCSILICRDCTLLNHRSHEYVDAADRLEVVTSKLANLLDCSIRHCIDIEREQQRIRRRADDAHTKLSNCRTEIEAHYAAFIAKITSDEDSLLTEVEKIEEEQCTPLDKQVTEITNQLEATRHTENLTRQILDGKRQWEILGSESHLKRTFERLMLENGAVLAQSSGADVPSRLFRFERKDLPALNSIGELKVEVPPTQTSEPQEPQGRSKKQKKKTRSQKKPTVKPFLMGGPVIETEICRRCGRLYRGASCQQCPNEGD